MKHAIILTVHDNVPVVKTALEMLDDKRFSSYLLVDAKSDIPSNEFVPQKPSQ